MSNNIKSMMEQLSENEFLLPVGYQDAEGVLHRVIKLKPMTGHTEEAISDPKVRDNGGKMMTELFFGVIESLGSVRKLNREVIRDLTTIDRDFLLIKNAQVSVGDEVSYLDTCPHCKGKNEVTVNIAELPVDYLEEDAERELTFDLPNGYIDRDGKKHKKITVILPTGRVQERVAQIIRANPAQATTLMLQLITKKLGDLDFLNPDVFKSLTKKDRDFISKKISEVEAGLSFSHDVYCSECGGEYSSSIPFSALLGE